MRKIRVNWCDSEAARAYVDSRQWEALAGSATLFTHHRGNNVYRAEVPPFGKVVVKESRLDGDYPFFERLGRELRFRLFDVNLREASVMGLVGAGGIGTTLLFAMNGCDWPSAGACLLGLSVVVLAADAVSSRLRRKALEI